MNDDLPYNRALEALASLLACVRRPGDFGVHGALALPMPMVENAALGGEAALPAAECARLAAAAARQPQAVKE